ncbi:unnamed protein product [Rotaria sp. Silwood2]|nr:unnamed protein product [Rotaria sp. Silwood2]CAF3070671.1 unnamed protein product [Rotaria sp. Silwood2]
MEQGATSGRSTCSIYNKERVVYKCGGCSQDCCFDHLAKHRQTLSKQLNEIENGRDQFHQTLVEQKKIPRILPLIQEVDKWEEDSIKKIKQTAEECRQILIEHQNKHFIEIEKELSQLTEQLKKIRQENEFNEIDLDRIKTKLTKLKEKLSQLPNIKLQQNSALLIKKLSTVVSSETHEEHKFNKNDLNQIQTKCEKELDQLPNISNSNDSTSVVDKSSINVSSAYGNKAKTYHRNQECSDSRNENRNGGCDNGDKSRSGDSSIGDAGSLDFVMSANHCISSMPLRFCNPRNQHKDNDNRDTEANFSGWQGDAEINSTIRVDFNTVGIGFRGGQVVRRRRVNSAVHGKTRSNKYETVACVCLVDNHRSDDCDSGGNYDDFSFFRGRGRGKSGGSGHRGRFRTRDSVTPGRLNSGSGDCNVNSVSSAIGDSSSMSVRLHNSRDQHGDDESDAKSSIRGSQDGAGSKTANDNDFNESARSTTCIKTNIHGGFNTSRIRFRGGRGMCGGRFSSVAHGKIRLYKYGKLGCLCLVDNRGRDGGGNTGGRACGQLSKRYVPPLPPTIEDGILGEAVTKDANFGKYHQTHVQYKVKPIKLYEEANRGTQVLSNIRRAHFEELTAIQLYTIPCIRQQNDIMACAQTGSGKTAAFLLPIISNLLEYHADKLSEKLHPSSPLCLIVSPTRELALQTEREARKFAYQTAVIPCSAVGGHDMYAVSDRLREGCHILSAITGRLKDMVEKGRVSLRKVKYFVLDEADRMLDTGFEPDIRKLEDLGLPLKDERFTSMFSATFSNEVQQLAQHFLRENYVFLAVGIPVGANEDIAQTIEEVPHSRKKDRLFQLLEENIEFERCLIFVETKRSADYIGALLSQRQFMTTTMHSDRTQRQRSKAIEQFTSRKCSILVATTVAACGLDFPLIGNVVNYDLPDTNDFHIHRIGRTGEINRDSDRKIAPELVLKLNEAGQTVPEFLRKYVDDANVGFYNDGQGSRNTDMRSECNNFGSRNQASGPTGGTTSAAATNETCD